MANAHAELLNFFANISDDEEEGRRKGQAVEAAEGRRNTHEFLRKNKMSVDQQSLKEANASKRQGFAAARGVNSLMSTVNSYKLLTAAIGRDEEGNEVGPSLEEFRIQRVVGSGAYAVVKLATHERTKKRVALKIYERRKLDAFKLKAVGQEIQCMRLLRSEFFPRLYADFETAQQQLVLVQEFVSGQSLF